MTAALQNDQHRTAALGTAALTTPGGGPGRSERRDGRPVRRLSFARTIDCALAHRRAVGETFLTDSARLADGDVVVAFQIPRAHLLWGDYRPGHHDPFAAAEAARQAAFVAFHQHLGIPLGLPFSMQRWDLDIVDQDAFLDVGQPLQGTIRYRLAARMSQPDHGRIALNGAMQICGRLAMTIGAEVTVAPRDDYRALRDYQRAHRSTGGPVGGWEAALRGRPAGSVLPSAVGRRDGRNCVIAPSRQGRHDLHLLVIDTDHPAFFDHEYDHVPGPLLAEGLRQAAIVTACAEQALTSPLASVDRLHTSFTDFAEFGEDVELVATVASGDGQRASLYLAVRQFDTEIASGRIDLHCAGDTHHGEASRTADAVATSGDRS